MLGVIPQATVKKIGIKKTAASSIYDCTVEDVELR